MIVAINYANEKYKKAQRYNSITARRHGADRVIEYSPESLDENFKKKNSSILSNERGLGYWLWKPYVILDALKKVQYNDYVIYTDAGSAYVDSIKKLIKTMNAYKQDIMVFSLANIEKKYTKRDAFLLMECDEPQYTDTPQRVGGYVLLKKSDFTLEFVKKWLYFCENENIISNLPNIMGKDDYDGFKENRHDQTVYSLLTKKYNLLTFRDPSQFGFDEGYDLAVGKEVMKRSTYPQIIDSHRNPECSHFYQLTYRKWYRWIDCNRSPIAIKYRWFISALKRKVKILFGYKDEEKN